MYKLAFTIVLTAGLFSCKNNSSSQKQSGDSDTLSAATIIKNINDSVDKEFSYTPSESQVVNPKYDDNKVHGIGIFKIGADESIINSLKPNYKSKVLYNQLEVASTQADYSYSSNKCLAVIKTPKSTYDDYKIEQSSYCPSVSVYWLSSYNVDGLKIQDVFATFYKSKLVKIECQWSKELEDAIEAKYGKSDIDQHSTEIKYYANWWNNGDVKSGYQSIDMRFVFEVKGIENFIAPCDTQEYNRLREEQKNKKKSDLKNL